MPKISVIVCVYNTKEYLPRCLDSLLSQTFNDFEILLMDDGSIDGCAEICDSYAKQDSRFRVFHNENHGVAWERQHGINLSGGAYSIHVDSDDWVESTMLEKLYDKAIETNADVVICDYYEDKSGKTRYVKQAPKSLNAGDIASEMFQNIQGFLWNKLVKHSCYKYWNISIPNIELCEDLYVSLSFMIHGAKVAYLPEAFYHYFRNINSVSITRAANPRAGINSYKMNIEFRKLLKPYPRYWKQYVKQSMPWQAYLVLYYGGVSSKEYRNSYSEMTSNPINTFNEGLTHLALRHYQLARAIISLRKLISRLL